MGMKANRLRRLLLIQSLDQDVVVEVKKDSDSEMGSDNEEEIVMSEENTPPPNDVASVGTHKQKTASMSFVSAPGNAIHRKPFEHLASLIAEKQARDAETKPPSVEEPVVAMETPIEKSRGRAAKRRRNGGSPTGMRKPGVQSKATPEGHPKGMIIPKAIDSTLFGVEFH